MLVERLNNAWIKFRVTGLGAKEAFLYVILAYNALNHQKVKMLAEIVERCPGVAGTISDEELFSAFEQLCHNLLNLNEILSPVELDWAERYVKSASVRKDMERIIYRRLAAASDYWNKLRGLFPWTLSDDEKSELIRQILADPSVGSKRKTELAEEFSLPAEMSGKLGYFRRLLWDKHYDQAAALKVSNPKVVIDVIVDNIDAGYVTDAAVIAKRFLPGRKDIADEINNILSALKS